MGINNIEKPSFFYNLLKAWVDFWHNRIFYQKIEIINAENIPKKGHLIFTPNHQNALMDAMAILCTIDRRSVFLARSDIFKKPMVASILYFLKILPIYRIRDGYESLKKNKEIFQKTTDVISNEKCALVILPEGNHAGFRRLRPLKKGFARIAFQTEEANEYKLDIQIVPVGIDYNDYQAFRSKLIVNFGKPISLNKYFDTYKVTPAIAINAIKQDLSEEIKTLIVNIESEKYYEMINFARMFYAGKEKKKNTLQYQQNIVNQFQNIENEQPEKISIFNQQIEELKKMMTDLKLNAQDQLCKKSLSSLLLKSFSFLLLLPLFFYGFINNIIPYQLTKRATSKIKDPQFKSSFSFVVSLVSFPIFAILQTSILMFFVKDWYLVIGYLLSLPLSGLFAWYYKEWLCLVKLNWKVYFISRNKGDDFNQTIELQNGILMQIDEIIKPENASI